ncbi:MAG TPA: serine hydrolase [Solirubrobacterales bacterium]|nr:serine hydrolase [Solirubrobacterales bacterium]
MSRAWFLTPAVICLLVAPGAAQAKRAWHPDVKAARRYARHRDGAVAFAVDERGRLRGMAMAGTAPAASVFKVMLLVAYLRMRHDRELSAGDRELLGPMIRRSDSVAATTVRDIVGVRRIERVARAAHMRDFRYAPVWGLSRTSPRDQARFMYRLRTYIPGRHRRYAFHLLARIVPSQRWGIGRVTTRGWRLYFKGGWGSGSGRVDHQVALLRRGDRKIAIAVFTQFDPDHAYGKRTLRGVFARLLRGLPAGPAASR